MREFIKSAISLSWATSLFGITQLSNLATPRQAASAFDEITQVTAAQLGDALGRAYQTGDRLQRDLVNLTFEAFNSGTLMQTTFNMMQQWGQAMGANLGLPGALPNQPREEVIVRHTVGQGRFSEDGKIVL